MHHTDLSAALGLIPTGIMLATLTAGAIVALAIGPLLAALATLVDAWTDARRAADWAAIVDAPATAAEAQPFVQARLDGYRVDLLPDLDVCAAVVDAPLPRALARMSSAPLGIAA